MATLQRRTWWSRGPTGHRVRKIAWGYTLQVEGKQNAVEKAQLRDVTFHTLRHTFASHFMMRGGNLFDLQKVLGHKDIKMTMRYAHLSPASAGLRGAHGGDHPLDPGRFQHTVSPHPLRARAGRHFDT